MASYSRLVHLVQQRAAQSRVVSGPRVDRHPGFRGQEKKERRVKFL